MYQLDDSATEYTSCYTHTRVLTLEVEPFQLRRLVENGLLFVLICVVWGVLLFVALMSLV
jgi:hypothetical protein